jgi:phosphoglycolate phosphatase/AHBA synthesis associated protein
MPTDASIPRPGAVLFDMDGVLIDSFVVWYELLNHAARVLGYPEISRTLYEECWGQSTAADRDRFFPRHSVRDVERFYDEHYAEHLEHLRVPKGSPEIIETLHEREIRTAVVTNTQRSLARLLVNRIGAAPETVVGGGDAPRGKPAPDLLLVACERLEIRPRDAWMVGDSVYDKEAARAAGVFFVGLGIDGDRRIACLHELGDLLGGG